MSAMRTPCNDMCRAEKRMNGVERGEEDGTVLYCRGEAESAFTERVGLQYHSLVSLL